MLRPPYTALGLLSHDEIGLIMKTRDPLGLCSITCESAAGGYRAAASRLNRAISLLLTAVIASHLPSGENASALTACGE